MINLPGVYPARGRRRQPAVTRKHQIVLPVHALVVLFIDTIAVLPPEISSLLTLIDDGICVFFLFDFVIRFRRAEDRLSFMKWGWIDMVSSIPAIGVLRAGRVFRLLRLLRILRAVRSTKLLIAYAFQNRKQGTFSAVAVLSVLLVIFSSSPF